MKQGFSGSRVTRKADVVIKETSDAGFVSDTDRHGALQRLSRDLSILPTIFDISGSKLTMEYIPGNEGLSSENAYDAGVALKGLHDQPGYPFPVFTGTDWLREKAIRALSDHDIALDELPDLRVDSSDEALIHTEPIQLITRAGGNVVFIDIEGIGLGSKYQDLGFVYYTAANANSSILFERLLSGYGSAGVDLATVVRFAGVISIAYSIFADSERRINLGLQLLRNAQQGIADDPRLHSDN